MNGLQRLLLHLSCLPSWLCHSGSRLIILDRRLSPIFARNRGIFFRVLFLILSILTRLSAKYIGPLHSVSFGRKPLKELLLQLIFSSISLVDKLLLLDVKHYSFKQVAVSFKHFTMRLNLLDRELIDHFLFNVQNFVLVVDDLGEALLGLMIGVRNLVLFVKFHRLLPLGL